MPDDIGQLTTSAIDPALRGGASATVEHGSDEIFDDLEIAVLGQHRLDVFEQRAEHLRGRRGPAGHRDEITAES